MYFLVLSVTAYWVDECVPGPAPYVLHDSPALDCAFRSLALEYSASNLGAGRQLESISRALNLEICNQTRPPMERESSWPSPAPQHTLQEACERAACFFVSLDGSDGNTGSADQPVASISRAQALARAHARTNVSSIYVWIRAGVYYEGTLRFAGIVARASNPSR